MQQATRAEAARLSSTHIKLGVHPKTGKVVVVPEVDRRAHMYVCGRTGSGKSSFLVNQILQDIAAKRTVICGDPHWDTIQNVVARVSPRDLERIYLLDMRDAEAYPYGLQSFPTGPVRTDEERSTAIAQILGIFNVLWPGSLSQQHLPLYLKATAGVFLDNPGSTLVDMLRFLRDPNFRRRLLRNVRDPEVLDFWADHEGLGTREGEKRLDPLVNRLRALFMGQSTVRNILGQRTTSVDFRRAIENREAIFINLPVNSMTYEAELIGTVLVSQIAAAIFSFVDTPEAARPGVSLYIDEFHNFTRNSPVFGKLITESRKYGARLVVCHQYLGQLTDELQQAVTATRTQVVFNIKPEDGPRLAKLFPGAGGRFVVTPEPVRHLLKWGHDSRLVQQFVQYYLRRLKGNLTVTDTTLTWGRALLAPFAAADVAHPERVDDPRYALNALLYDVMQRRDAAVPIPREIAIGFSGCGPNPFLVAATKAKAELLPDYELPGWLRQRDPQDGREQLLHFLACLRFTMAELAANPLGEWQEGRPADTARLLTQLKPRWAWVRSDQDMATIYTEDMPPPLQGAALQARLDRIQDQTRRKYCRPREDVEAAFTPDEPVEDNDDSDIDVGTMPEPDLPPNTGTSHWDELLEDD